MKTPPLWPVDVGLSLGQHSTEIFAVYTGPM